MDKLPPLPQDAAITWRALNVDDAAALLDYHVTWESANNLPYRTSLEETIHNLSDPATDHLNDTLAAFGSDGSIMAVAWLHCPESGGRKHRSFLLCHALPERSDLEEFVMDWGIARSNRKLGEFGDALPRVLRAWAEDHMSDYIARWQKRGFKIVRYFVDMIRPLAEPIPDIVIPADVEIITWDDQMSRSAYETRCGAFADHWGTTPPSWEAWEHTLVEPHFRKDLSLMAVVDGEVVSISMNGVYPDDVEVRGRREGWIDTLGTDKLWRKKGLASALIAESMRRFRADGLDHAALGVDVDSPTGALGLYAGLGFREESRSVALLKDYPG